MASSLTSAQRQELKDAFDVFDTGRHINKKNHPFFLFVTLIYQQMDPVKSRKRN